MIELLKKSAAVSAKPDSIGVIILGGGVTGAAVAAALSGAGIRSAILDQGAVSPAALKSGAKIFENFDPEAGPLPVSAVFAVTSPGIGPEKPLPELIRRAGIPIVTELDLAFSVLGMPLVAVTGTNGKTTTTTIIDAMLRASGISTALVGNIGTPPIELIAPSVLNGSLSDRSNTVSADPALIAEVSSYQLECARSIRPRVGVWLNLDDNHLERHKTIERYLEAKARLFADQDPLVDFSVIGADDPRAGDVVRLAHGRLVLFGSTKSAEQFAAYSAGDLPFAARIGCFLAPGGRSARFCRFDSPQPAVEDFSLENARLLGRHNRLNFAAAISAARLAGGSHSGIQETIDSFEPIEHRIEILNSMLVDSAAAQSIGAGILPITINDSKSTNPLASAVALSAVHERYKDRSIILILGGLMKQGSWKPLADQFEQSDLLPSVSSLVIFGPDRELIDQKLRSELSSKTSAALADRIELFPKIDPAIERALALQSGSIIANKPVVLFSPGCASFDEFSDYTARGRHFKELVVKSR